MEWISQNAKLVATCISTIAAVIGWWSKHRATMWDKCKVKISEAIEKAEMLKGATGEQKKAYAMALCNNLKIATKRISDEMERQLLLTKNVNVKSYKQEENY